MSVGGGDVGDTGGAECADGGVAQGGHDLGSGAGADLGAVLVVGDVPHVVDLVLDVPVAADPGGELGGFGLVQVQAGDGIDGLGGEPLRLIQAAPATADLQRLRGVREPDPGGDGEDLQGADLAAAVSTVGVAGGVRDGTPGQSGELGVQAGLVGFDGQDPVGAAVGEVGDVVPLAVQGVDGDDGVAQVAELVEQRPEPGDLVGVPVDVRAGQHGAGGVLARGEHVPGGGLGGAGAAQGRAVDRD